MFPVSKAAKLLKTAPEPVSNLTLVFASDPHLFQYQFNLLLILVGMVLIFWRPSPRLPPSFVSRLCDNFVFANILPFLSEEGDIAA
jgi:hypothetical protein